MTSQKTYRLYLDNCCFNRPFDNQEQLKIKLETEAERFITLINREPFDYTEWQRNLFEGKSVRELSKEAMQTSIEVNNIN